MTQHLEPGSVCAAARLHPQAFSARAGTIPDQALAVCKLSQTSIFKFESESEFANMGHRAPLGVGRVGRLLGRKCGGLQLGGGGPVRGRTLLRGRLLLPLDHQAQARA